MLVAGLAAVVADPDCAARYEQLLHPWAHLAMNTVIAISLEIINGMRIRAHIAPTEPHDPELLELEGRSTRSAPPDCLAIAPWLLGRKR